MNEVATAAVQQVQVDLAFYKRHERWVDSRLVSKESEVKPGRVVEFGSAEFRAGGQAGERGAPGEHRGFMAIF